MNLRSGSDWKVGPRHYAPRISMGLCPITQRTFWCSTSRLLCNMREQLLIEKLGGLVPHVPRSGWLRDSRPEHHYGRRRGLLSQLQPDHWNEDQRREKRRLD